jgi:hypothetical protein
MGICHNMSGSYLVIIVDRNDVIRCNALPLVYPTESGVYFLGAPRVEKVQPVPDLHIYHAVCRGMIEKADAIEYFWTVLGRWRHLMEEFGPHHIQCKVVRTGTLFIGHIRLRCFDLNVFGVSPKTSLALQVTGFGGRESRGCGLVMPAS